MGDYMPDIRQYMALAEALHDASDLCNASYVIPLEECGAREADVEDAVRILVALRKEGWLLVQQPVGAMLFGLT